MTANSMTFTGPVQLQNTITMSTSAANGNISFASTLDALAAGTQGLTLNKGTGTLTFAGSVGGATSLVSLAADASGSVVINTGSITTTGAQTYSGPVTLGNSATLTTTGGNILLGSTLAGGGNNLALGNTNGSGTFTVTGTVTGLGTGTGAAFSTAAAMTGAVKFQGAVTAANGLTFGTSTPVEFDNTVTITGSQTGTTTGATSTTTFGQGAAQVFTSAGTVAFNGNVSLSAGTALNLSTTFQDILVGGTINGAAAGQSLTVSTGSSPGPGNVTLHGTIGSNVGPLLLEADNLTLGNGAAISVSTTGAATQNITFHVDGLANNNSSVNAGTGTFKIYPRTIGNDIEVSQTRSLGTPIWYDAVFNSVAAAAMQFGDTTYTGHLYLGNSNPTTVTYATLTQTSSSSTTTVGNWNASVANKSLTINSSGTSAPVAFQSLPVSGTATVTLGTGTFDLWGAATLSNDASVTANGGINFHSTIDGAQALSLQSTGTTTLTGAVGGTPLTSISVTGPLAVNGGAITTSGTQTYALAVTLGADTVFTANSGVLVWFKSTVAGTGVARALTITTANAEFDGAVSGLVSSVSVGGSSTVNTTTIQSTGAQVYSGIVTLGAAGPTTISTTSNGDITFSSALNGPGQALTVNAGVGNVKFGSTVASGASPLGALQVTGGTGSTAYIKPTGNIFAASMQFTGPTQLQGTLTLNTTPSGAVTFLGATSTIDASAASNGLTVNAGSGIVTFGGVIGGGTPLGGLSVTSSNASTAAISTVSASVQGSAPGTLTFNGKTTLNGTWTTANQNVTVGGLLTLTGAATSTITTGSAATTSVVDLSNGITTGALNLNVNASGGQSGAGTIKVGIVTGTGTVQFGYSTPTATVSGSLQLFGGITTGTFRTGTAATVESTLTATSSAGPIQFNNTVDGNTGGEALTLSAGAAGAVILNGSVGSGTALQAITLTGTGINLGSTSMSGPISVITSANQSYNSPVTLGQNLSLNSSSSNGNIAFAAAATVTASSAGGQTLSVNAGTGNVTFGGSVGSGAVPLGALTVAGGTGTTAYIIPKANMTATSMSFTGPVQLQSALIQLDTSGSGGNVSFLTGTSKIDAQAAGSQGLTITAGTGNVVFTAAVGSAQALASLSVTGGTGTTAYIKPFANVTAGSLSFTGPMQLQNSLTMATTSNGNAGFSGTVDSLNGAQALTVNVGTGTATFGGIVGGGQSLSTLAVTGVTAINTTGITTLGTQTYTGNVTLGASTTLATTGANILMSANLGGSFDLALGTTNGNGTFTVSGNVTSLGTGIGITYAFTAPAGVTAKSIFAGNVTAASGFSTVALAPVEFRGNVTISGGTASGFNGDVSFTTAATHTFTTAVGVTFAGNTTVPSTGLLTIGSTAALVTVKVPSPGVFTVGAGGLTINGNFDGTGGSLVGTPGADLTFSTPAGNDTTVTLGTFTHNGERVVFNAGAALRIIALVPNAATPQTFADVLVGNGTNTKVSLTDTRLVIDDARTLTIAASSFLLLTSTAVNDTGVKLGVSAGGSTLVNNGTFIANTNASKVFVWGKGTNNVITNNAVAANFLFSSTLTPSVGLANVKVNGVATTLSGQTLALEDNNVTLGDVSLFAGTTLDFLGLGLITDAGNTKTNSHSLTVTGNWTSNPTSILANQNTGTPTTVTFNNTAAATITMSSVAPAQQFQNWAQTGTALLTLSSSLGVAGNLIQTGSPGVDFSNQEVLAGGNVTLTNATTSSSSVLYLLPTAIPGSRTLTVTPSFLGDIVLDAAGGSTFGIRQGGNISARSVLVYRGIWDVNNKTLATSADLLVYGTGYANYTINGTSYNPNDDGELASRGAGYYTGLLGYPYYGNVAGPTKTVGGAVSMDTTLGNFLAVGANNLNTSGRPAVPASGGMTGQFAFTGGGTVNVGQNFYNYGAAMTGAAWTLNSAPKWSGKQLNNAKNTDWFGKPFSVAITTTAATIQNSTAVPNVAAAQTSFGPGFTLTGTSGWDGTQPTISSASTRFDNLVEVTFSKTMLNANGEAANAVNQGTLADNLRFASGNVFAGALWDFQAGLPGTNGVFGDGTGEYKTQSAVNANKATLSFQTTGSNTWATDATGASAGAATSTDRSGHVGGWNGTTSGSNFVPNITIEKGRLYDASGNPIRNYDALNYNGTSLSTRYTATADKARPVLIKIDLGQAAKNFTPATKREEDGHNYWHFVWSEPVDFANVAGTAAAISGVNAAGQIGDLPDGAVLTGNITAVSSFGDSFTSSGTTVQLTGIAQYTGLGPLYRGSRAQQTGGSPLDLTVPSNQTLVTPTNSLARSAGGNDLYVYLTGASNGVTWDGFWWGDTNSASGKVYTVVSAYVNQVRDRANGTGNFAANNPVEDQFVLWAAAGALPPTLPAADPKTNYTLTNDSQVSQASPETTTVAHTGWELDAPSFARYTPITSPPTALPYEVVPYSSAGAADPDRIDQVQIHILANVGNSGQTWDSAGLAPNGHPDTTQVHFGVRDTSLTSFPAGFGLNLSSATSGISTFNLPMTGGLSDTTVKNSLFTPSGPMAALGNPTVDDGYFTLPLTQTGMPNTWKPIAVFKFFYNMYAGMATNLAGRLISSTPASGNLAIDRSPPYITLTLAAVGSKKVYVQLSRVSIALDKLGDTTNYKNVFQLVGTSSNGNSIASVTFKNPSGSTYATSNAGNFQEAIITLTKPLAAADVSTLLVSAINYPSNALPVGNPNGNSTITALRNDMDWTISYPISFLGIDLVQPVWASDGQGGEANKTGTARVIHDFTGLEALTANDITLQASILGSNHYTQPLRLFYDLNVPAAVVANGVWLPKDFFQPSGITDKVPQTANTAARYVDPTATNGTNLRTFVIPGGDPEMKAGGELQFVFRLGSLYTVRSTDPTDPTKIGVYRVPLKGIKEQKNGVTILHNVIDPTQGQQTQILYTMPRAGVVTVQVFALDGSLVKILHRGRQASGDYSLTWDGRNEGGKIVARGVYFIRVVAPDTDETRNVLVIK
jgi:hypothetical protein